MLGFVEYMKFTNDHCLSMDLDANALIKLDKLLAFLYNLDANALIKLDKFLECSNLCYLLKKKIAFT